MPRESTPQPSEWVEQRCRATTATAGVSGGADGVKTRVADVDGDGRMDLVVDFPLAGVLFNDHDIVADVWGRTTGGIPFSGTDLVEIVR